MTLRAAALCAGYAGLEMALAEVLGAELAWYCEHEPPTKKHPKPANAAAKVMAHRFPGVPNHGDLTVADWTQVEPVDLLAFGWPCQPWSAAGKQLGADDERAIWPDIAHAIGVLRPRYLFAENVPGVVVRGELARVLADLARLGFDAEWCCVRASAVGAPHRRERFFLFAANAENVGHQRTWEAWQRWSGSPDHRCHASHSDRIEGGSQGSAVHGHGHGHGHGQDGIGAAEPGRRGGVAPDPEGVGRGEGRPEHAWQLGGSGVAIGGDASADTDGCERRAERDSEPVEPRLEAPLGADPDGRVLDWAGYRPAIEQWERALGRSAPAPTVLGQRGGQQLNPAFVEFLMGLPEGWVCDVPGLTRNQKLKVLGNGVVPQQAAAALRHLLPLLTSVAVAA